jgi:hypothetical protein
MCLKTAGTAAPSLPIRSFDYLVLHHRQDQGKVLHAGFLHPAVEAEGDKLYRPLKANAFRASV